MKLDYWIPRKNKKLSIISEKKKPYGDRRKSVWKQCIQVT